MAVPESMNMVDVLNLMAEQLKNVFVIDDSKNLSELLPNHLFLCNNEVVTD